MQAIELETDISPEGQICLPSPLRGVYGRHARLILLFDDKPPSRLAIDRLAELRGFYEDDQEFDAAMEELDEAWQQWP